MKDISSKGFALFKVGCVSLVEIYRKTSDLCPAVCSESRSPFLTSCWVMMGGKKWHHPAHWPQNFLRNLLLMISSLNSHNLAVIISHLTMYLNWTSHLNISQYLIWQSHQTIFQSDNISIWQYFNLTTSQYDNLNMTISPAPLLSTISSTSATSLNTWLLRQQRNIWKKSFRSVNELNDNLLQHQLN